VIWILLAIVVLAVIFVISMYNGLVSLKVQCDNAWSDIDVQLKRRYDLIPNLVETVKGYAAHEQGTLEGVVAARNRAMSTQGPAAKAEAEGVLTSALRQVFALAEAYPQLRAVESFTQLQNTLNQIEDSVQNAVSYTHLDVYKRQVNAERTLDDRSVSIAARKFSRACASVMSAISQTSRLQPDPVARHETPDRFRRIVRPRN